MSPNALETSMSRQEMQRTMSKQIATSRRPTIWGAWRSARLSLTGVIVGCVWLVGASQALAQTSAPQWTITPASQPTNLAPASSYGVDGDEYNVVLVNGGGAPTDGTAVTITDTLPAGVSLDSAGATGTDNAGNTISCTGLGQTVTCTDPDSTPLQPGEAIFATIPVDVSSGAPSSVTNQVSVSGGGAPAASVSGQTTISAASAAFGPVSFSTGSSNEQAGAHADLTTSIVFATGSQGVPVDNARNITVDLPVGFAGYATSVPTCPPADLYSSGTNLASADCPVSTQVGTVSVYLNLGSPSSPTPIAATLPVYNITPAGGQTAQFAFNLLAQIVTMNVSVRPGDDGLEATLNNLPSSPVSTFLTLWGVPADPSHDALRGASCLTNGQSCTVSGGGASAGLSPAPLLRNPTRCTATPLTATMMSDSWEQPDTYVSATSPLGPFTSCDALQFDPSISVAPAQSTPDTPSGYTVDLTTPQNSNPDAAATADLENAAVTLPAGVVLSPSAADGLQDCTNAQVGLGNASPPACPDGSQIGEATLKTPALPDQMTGSIYLGGPDSGPITGPPYRIFLALAGDGVSVKLVGTVTPNPATGQLTTTFDDNPQLPFSDLRLTFNDGPRAPLTTPSTCGTFTATSDLEPWSAPDSGPDATPSSSFAITGCGGDPFAPTFAAGTINPQAGSYSPFTLTFSRTDADQEFSGLTATLPPGLVAKLAGVPLCSDANANAGTCPASSQVGVVQAASGPGSRPFWLPGTAYLTGPYKGGPYGLAVEIPAVAGPFNLGTVVVRNSIQLNPTTAQVTVTSDPFPTIIGGIPIQLRTVNIDMNRPGFMLNPTSCDPMTITAGLSSTGGMNAPVSSRFQVGGCSSLGFTPKLKIGLSGKGQTKSGDHPTLTATLTDRSGQANLRSAKVTLPLSMALDPNNSNHVCNYATAAAVHGGPVACPTKTIVGKATADTPLLSKPLTGNVYLVQGLRCQTGPLSAQGTCANGKTAIHTLPTLLVPLRGQIALDLRAKSSVNGAGALVTTFSTIPDAPVSKFTLQITGGKKGLLVITGRGQSICGKPQVASENLGAQSGKSMVADDTLTTPCKATKK